MSFNINAPSYVPPKVKLKKTYNLVFGNISAIKIAYFIPTRFFRATGTLQFDEIEWELNFFGEDKIGLIDGFNCTVMVAMYAEFFCKQICEPSELIDRLK